MRSPTVKIPFKVLGKNWELRIWSCTCYVQVGGSDSVAITDCNKRRIDLHMDGRDRETIIHELVHAYLGEICVRSADLDNDNLEEIFAELLSKRGEEMFKLADKLTAQVKKVGK